MMQPVSNAATGSEILFKESRGNWNFLHYDIFQYHNRTSHCLFRLCHVETWLWLLLCKPFDWNPSSQGQSSQIKSLCVQVHFLYIKCQLSFNTFLLCLVRFLKSPSEFRENEAKQEKDEWCNEPIIYWWENRLPITLSVVCNRQSVKGKSKTIQN